MLNGESIPSRTTRVREFINDSRLNYNLHQDRGLFSQVASSLDAIEDTEQAIRAFLDQEFGDSLAAHYLAVYGLLQAMVVQQDATDHLCEGLQISPRTSTCGVLKDIRSMRHDSIGHPTKRDRPRGAIVSHHQISQISLSQSGFDLFSYYADGRNTHRRINIPQLVQEQRRCIDHILAQVVKHWERVELTHRKKFRMVKLADTLPEQLEYYLGKVSESVEGRWPASIGRAQLEMVCRAVEHFFGLLDQRNRECSTRLRTQYELLRQAFTELEAFLTALEHGKSPVMGAMTATILVSFADYQVKELRHTAQQIDTDYVADGRGSARGSDRTRNRP